MPLAATRPWRKTIPTLAMLVVVWVPDDLRAKRSLAWWHVVFEVPEVVGGDDTLDDTPRVPRQRVVGGEQLAFELA